jgi:hypothetical protein
MLIKYWIWICVCLHTYLCYIDEISYKMIRLVGSINNLHIFLHALFKTNNLKNPRDFVPLRWRTALNTQVLSGCVFYCLFTKIWSYYTNYLNINKMNNHLSLQTTDHKKDHEIWRLKFKSWLGTDTKMWRDIKIFNLKLKKYIFLYYWHA